MFDNISVNYRRLLPGTGSGEEGEGDHLEDPPSFGIYEDDETRRLREAHEDRSWREYHCPWVGNYVMDILPTLGWRERLLGCLTCMVCGYLLSWGSFLRLRSLMGGNPVPLVLNVTVGNIISICGTCFLTGPQSQVRRMFHKSRKVASGFYIGSLGVTLLLLAVPKFRGKGTVLFLLLIGQYVAIFWYCLSYIPFARQMVTQFVRRLVRRGSFMNSNGDDDDDDDDDT